MDIPSAQGPTIAPTGWRRSIDPRQAGPIMAARTTQLSESMGPVTMGVKIR